MTELTNNLSNLSNLRSRINELFIKVDKSPEKRTSIGLESNNYENSFSNSFDNMMK